MKEIWMTIKDYENRYKISNKGRVKTMCKYSPCGRNKIIKGSNVDGYISVVLVDSFGNIDRCFVHRLVATAFIPNPNNYPIVHHIDENRSNNIVTNLKWCTQK